ncbi:MAG: DUF3179 domain-containing protein [Acidimicrobiia bacterium]|nr:DUF3179 domain-containing protein [Acidimicrobiia bacterium]
MSKHLAVATALVLVVAACSQPSPDPPTPAATDTTNTTTANTITMPPPAPPTTPGGDLLPAQDIPLQLTSMAEIWETDFSRAVIDLNELLVGLPSPDPRDLIRPIDQPVFEAVDTSTWLADREPGVLVDIDDDVRFYPLSVLTRHEIVNDEIAGIPVAVTYCPLCNTAVVFDRRFEGTTLRLGVSGLLRNSDLVMWDNVTQTLWQQITGEAIVGTHAGKSLTRLGSGIVRWADFKASNPDGLVLGPDQGFGEIYGRNGYAFYSSRPAPYAFYTDSIDPRFPAMSRVVGVRIGDTDKAYPFGPLSQARVANDEIAGAPIVVLWGAADTADALDGSIIATSQAIGTGIAYDPVVNGETLTFEAVSDTEFVDHQTGTTWTILGEAIDGELVGTQLELIPHTNEFWFAWQAFFPDGEVWAP